MLFEYGYFFPADSQPMRFKVEDGNRGIFKALDGNHDILVNERYVQYDWSTGCLDPGARILS